MSFISVIQRIVEMYRNILISFYCAITTQSLLQPPEIQIHPINQCVYDIQNTVEANYFNYYLIAYFDSTQHQAEEFARSLTITTRNTVKTLNLNKQTKPFISIPDKFFIHIIFLKEYSEFQLLLKTIYRTAIWNANARYIVAFFGAQQDYKMIFELAWMYYVINIDLIDETLQLNSYLPYENESCGQNIQSVVIGKCQEIGEPFPNKIPKNFYGCPLRLMVNIYPPFVINPRVMNESATHGGLDMAILNTFVRKFNLTKQIRASPSAFAFKLSNGNYSGSLFYLDANISDMAIGSLFPNLEFFIDFDISSLYYEVHFSWIVPAAKQGKQWKSLVLIFNLYLWLIIFAVIGCNFIIWWVFGKHTSDKTYFEEISICMLKCWYVFLQGGISLPYSATMRILVIFWAFFALLLATLYQSQLLSIMLTPVFEHQISNGKELGESSVHIYLKQEFVMRLNNSGRPSDKIIIQKSIMLSSADHSAVQRKYHENGAFLATRAASLYQLPRNYSYPSGKIAMHICKDYEFGNPIAMFFRKGFPLIELYNQYLSNAISGGLLAKWVKDATFFMRKVEDDSGPQKVTLNHLAGIFFLLCLGMVHAVLLLIIEIICKKCVNKYSSK